MGIAVGEKVVHVTGVGGGGLGGVGCCILKLGSASTAYGTTSACYGRTVLFATLPSPAEDAGTRLHPGAMPKGGSRVGDAGSGVRTYTAVDS
jgi:hypothetical protein